MPEKPQMSGAVSSNAADASRLSLLNPPKITIFVGHAGVGKTNTSMGIALDLSARGHDVILADLDVVNPYFRSSDYPELLESHGIRLVAPFFARTTLDTPSLTGEVDAIIEDAAKDGGANLILDVGGDDGAVVLGRYSRRLNELSACMLYVVSAFRGLSTTPEEAAALLAPIEENSRMRAMGIVNASNLSTQTTLADVRHGRDFAKRCSELLGLPLVATIVPEATISNEGLSNVNDVLRDGEEAFEELLCLPKLISMPWE